jgi:hypothetical protein
MKFDFDPGSSGGGEGPFIVWTARGTQDGVIPPRSWCLKTKDGNEPFACFERGVVLDIHNMKTGWCFTEGTRGVAPKWKWNPGFDEMLPSPGEDYKKGFAIRCAYTKTDVAVWEQAGVAAWNAFVNLLPAIQQGPEGESLPLVRMTGTEAEQFGARSTVTPVLEIVKWVDRPDCLKAAGNGTGARAAQAPVAPPPAAAARPAATPTQPPAAAPAGDFDEF